MNQNLTEIVFLLDRSGSMGHLASDTIGGYNSFIKTQKECPGEARLTTVLFDGEYEILHNAVNIKDVEDITSKEYFARGTTSMLDAIGRTINTVGQRLANEKEEDRPFKVIFVITTDGLENTSVEFTKDQIKEMIEHQQWVYSWEFIFLGANMDAVDEGSNIGIARSATYTASSVGVDSVYASMSKGISNLRDLAITGESGEELTVCLTQCLNSVQ